MDPETNIPIPPSQKIAYFHLLLRVLQEFDQQVIKVLRVCDLIGP